MPVSGDPFWSIDATHWLQGAQRVPIPGGQLFTPLCVVIHYTEGFSAAGSVSGWKEKANGILAHVVVDRDGTIFQCRPFNRTCGHAGTSRWRDPVTGKLHFGVNTVGIGIELANTGMQEALHAKLNKGKPYPYGSVIAARHRNGHQGSSEAARGTKWEAYPEAQRQAVFDLAALLLQRYDLHDITGHDCIAPERKADPGPAFPMAELRRANGLAGLPEVLDTKGNKINV